MKTLDVKLLVDEVLAQLPKPYTEHVIDDVFFAIESRAEWRQLYDSLCKDLTKTVANNWGGRWVGIALGKVGEKQVPSRRSSLIESYSLLDTDASTIARKRTEAQALEVMSKHFFSNRTSLPEPTVRARRETIVKLLMQGLQADVAFAAALDGDA
jgi:hypothetical protein